MRGRVGLGGTSVTNLVFQKPTHLLYPDDFLQPIPLSPPEHSIKLDEKFGSRVRVRRLQGVGERLGCLPTFPQEIKRQVLGADFFSMRLHRGVHPDAAHHRWIRLRPDAAHHRWIWLRPDRGSLLGPLLRREFLHELYLHRKLCQHGSMVSR